MDDLDRYIKKRAEANPEYWSGFEQRYREFKIGLLLKMARKEARMTQEQVAAKMGTKKSVISRLENQAEDMKVTTLFRYLDAVGKKLQIA
jgi:HTH-type transcriptional regulator / antitoxin HipB